MDFIIYNHSVKLFLVVLFFPSTHLPPKAQCSHFFYSLIARPSQNTTLFEHYRLNFHYLNISQLIYSLLESDCGFY